jgi:hypothetical protein
MKEMSTGGTQNLDPDMLGIPIYLNTALEALAPPQGRRSENDEVLVKNFTQSTVRRPG